MKIKRKFVVHRNGGESYLVPLGGTDFSGIVKGNELLGDILFLLQKEIRQEDLIDALCEQIDAPRKTLEQDVNRVISTLRDIGALEE